MDQFIGSARPVQTYYVIYEATSQATRVEAMPFQFSMNQGVMHVRHSEQFVTEFPLGDRLSAELTYSGIHTLPFTFQEQEDGTVTLTGVIHNNALYALV